MGEFIDIPEFEGYYQINSDGDVKSLDKLISPTHNGTQKRFKAGRILKPNKGGRYLVVVLVKDAVKKNHLVHRLVAAVFIPNPENKPCVNHKNGQKWDNRAANLEWCTRSENSQHAYDNGLILKKFGRENPMFGRTGAKNTRSRIVFDTQTGIFYESIKEAAYAKCIKRSALQERLLGITKQNKTGLIYA